MRSIKQLFAILVCCFSMIILINIFIPNQALNAAGARSCDVTFFGIPTWHKYMAKNADCTPIVSSDKDQVLSGIIGPITLAIVDILLRISGMVTVALIIWGGIRYTTSQGDPSATKAAKDTILNAFIGTIIVIFAIAIVNFIGTKL